MACTVKEQLVPELQHLQDIFAMLETWRFVAFPLAELPDFRQGDIAVFEWTPIHSNPIKVANKFKFFIAAVEVSNGWIVDFKPQEASNSPNDS